MLVVRDDLYPGGTKARFVPDLIEGARESVYAGPAEGGAAVALATVATTGATLFYAARNQLHPRQEQAKRLGANLKLIRPGYLSVVKARAREYCEATGARLLPWGMDTLAARHGLSALAAAIRADIGPVDQVWCAAGSGVLLRALSAGFPDAAMYGVQVGHSLTPQQAGRASIIRQSLKFEQRCAVQPPFPSDAHYDAKAWAIASQRRHGRALFWNVLG